MKNLAKMVVLAMLVSTSMGLAGIQKKDEEPGGGGGKRPLNCDAVSFDSNCADDRATCPTAAQSCCCVQCTWTPMNTFCPCADATCTVTASESASWNSITAQAAMHGRVEIRLTDGDPEQPPMIMQREGGLWSSQEGPLHELAPGKFAAPWVLRELNLGRVRSGPEGGTDDPGMGKAPLCVPKPDNSCPDPPATEAVCDGDPTDPDTVCCTYDAGPPCRWICSDGTEIPCKQPKPKDE